MAVETSRVLPFQTSSTSRLSSNRRNRYFSGSGLSSWMSLMRSRFSASESSYLSSSCCRFIERDSVAVSVLPGPFREAGAGHAFTQAALLNKSFFELATLLIEQEVGLMNRTYRSHRTHLFSNPAA